MIIAAPHLPRFAALVLGALLAMPLAAQTQGTGFSLGGMRHDSSAPIEVSADRLSVDQASGASVFSGNAVIGQGAMRLSAALIRIEYVERNDDLRIERLLAEGGVTFVTATEAAEAAAAEYHIEAGRIVMTGDVVLTQGRNVLSGDRLEVNLRSGEGTMEGRVRTIIFPGE